MNKITHLADSTSRSDMSPACIYTIIESLAEGGVGVGLPPRLGVPGSRRKAHYLMSIHEQLPRSGSKQLKQVGWSKAAELAKVARRDGEHFECANWLRKAESLPVQEFKDEVEKYLTGESEPSELIYFKLYRSQLPVIEQALEIAARMLGSDKARGYCLEMICADFLAGVDMPTGQAA